MGSFQGGIPRQYCEQTVDHTEGCVCVCVLCVLRVCAHMVGGRVQSVSVGECGCRVEGGGHGIVLTG